MKQIIFVLLIIVLIGAFPFLQNINVPVKFSDTGKGKLRITTSFYPLYFFASEIGGDKVEVKNITPAGAQPHEYEPTTQDLVDIENSTLLILNGGSLESWENKIRDNLEGKSTFIIAAGEGLITNVDPHVWLNPQLAKKQAEKIREGMGKRDAANSVYYDANAKKLEDKLDKLDTMFAEGLKNCGQKDIITSHGAFGYLAKEYGFSQVTISGVSPEEEPSAKQLASITKFAKEHSIKYIFFESLVSPKLSETIANEIGARTLALDPIEGISDDDRKRGKDYFTVMEDNLKNLQTALACKT